MYETLLDVPVAIREFYEESIVDEITVVNEKTRYDLKTWADVERVKAKGSSSAVPLFIVKAVEADNWVQHDKYTDWLDNKPDPDSDKYIATQTSTEGVEELIYSYPDDLLDWNNAEPTVSLSSPDGLIEAYTTEEAISSFKANRQSLIDNAVVEANGFQFDADEVSIGRLASAILAAIDELDTFVMQWSLADTATGAMTDVTLADLKLAHKLAVINMASVWGS